MLNSINPNKVLHQLRDSDLTFDAYIFLFIMVYDRKDLIGLFKSICRPGMEVCKELHDKGFIIIKADDVELPSYVKSSYNGFYPSRKALDMFINPDKCFDELWKKYPAYKVSGGVNYPLKGIDMSKMKILYLTSINYSNEEHIEIMKDLSYAIKNNLITNKIETFIKNQAWNDIRQRRINLEDETISFSNDENIVM